MNFESGLLVPGRNYGWRAREGSADNPSVPDPAPANATGPIFDYTHGSTAAGRASITGGYVYRGDDIAGLEGTYFFGDFVNGTFGSFRYNGTAVTSLTDLTPQLDPTGTLFPNDSLSSFGQDGFGELYAVNITGAVYKIVPEPSATLLFATTGALFLARRTRTTRML